MRVCQAEIDLGSIEQTLITIRANLGNLSFESKRLALEALNIRITLGKDTIAIEGTLPMRYNETPSRPSEHNTPQNITHSLPFCILVKLGDKR